MRRRLRASTIAYAASVALAVALAATVAGARAAPADCAPAVRVSGDGGAAGEIRDALTARGLGDDTSGHCPLVHARVVRRGDRLRVEVTDGYGRRSQRDVQDAGTAVALIESWARPEVVASDLPGAGDARVASSVVAPVDVVAVDAPPGRARVTAPGPAASGIALAIGAITAADGSTWIHGRASACRAIGHVCLGGVASAERDLQLDGAPHPRSSWRAGGSIEVPFTRGRFAVAPGAALALGWERIGGLGPHHDQHQDSATLHAGAGVAARAALSRRWALAAELAGDAVVLGGVDLVPGTTARLSLGLRYGVP
jgi:hypothetical protein